uniref:Uncharacterized protein n=1 Tax=Physcomitrium patens TaxID=3218 RepID=A0A2K1JUP6_PHYPA|nr:hypothetical protein PHYPA_015033 [Physcomitrium patens]
MRAALIADRHCHNKPVKPPLVSWSLRAGQSPCCNGWVVRTACSLAVYRISRPAGCLSLELLEPFFAEQPPVTRRRCSPVKITVLGIIVTTRDRPCQRSTLSSQHSQVFPINFPKSTRRSKPSFSHRKIPQQIEGCRIAWAKQGWEGRNNSITSWFHGPQLWIADCSV